MSICCPCCPIGDNCWWCHVFPNCVTVCDQNQNPENGQIGQSGPYPDQATCQANCLCTNCCNNPLPSQLFAHFTDLLGNCPCLDGLVLLLQNTGPNTWKSADNVHTPCDSLITLTLTCTKSSGPSGDFCGSFQIGGFCGKGGSGGGIPAQFPNSCTCSPFQLVFNGVPVAGGPGGGCCGNQQGGDVKIIISTT